MWPRPFLHLLTAIALALAGLGGVPLGHAATTTATAATYDYDHLSTFAQGADRSSLRVVASQDGLAPFRLVARFGVAAEEADSGALIFRGGTQTDNALTDKGSGLWFRDSLSNPANQEDAVLRPGEKYFAVDPSRLRPGSVVRDNVPPGHVWVKGLTPDEIRQAIVDPQGDPFLGGKFPR